MGLVATFAKVGFGVICFLFLTAVSIAMTVISSGVYFGEVWALKIANSASFANFLLLCTSFPLLRQ